MLNKSSLPQKLKESSILDESEPVLSLIQVSDYVKYQQQFKKIAKEELNNLLSNTKSYYLLASIKTADNDSTPLIYLLKTNEKNSDIKLKVTYYLNEIKSLTKIDDKLRQQSLNGNQIETEIFAFQMEFENENSELVKFVWQCNKREDRDDFLDTLWKLSEQFLKQSDRPKFLNYQAKDKRQKFDESSGTAENDHSSLLGNQQQQKTESFELSKKDEESLLKLMSECDFDSSNAEQFIKKLQTELVLLDTSNIESIMNSEENTIRLIEKLDKAFDEIEKIDKRLQDYDDKIGVVSDAVRLVGERDNFIQLQQNNQHALLELLDGMISTLDFSSAYESALLECNLSSPKRVQQCAQAANELMDILESDVPPALRQMKAYVDQKNKLEKLKFNFADNLFKHFRNMISQASTKHMESYTIRDNSLTQLPDHKQIHDDLLAYKDLLAWLQRSTCSLHDANATSISYFDLVKNEYIQKVTQLYLREFGPFVMCARAKIAKIEQRMKNSTGSMDNLKGSFRIDKNTGDPFSIRIDSQTKETLKLVFIKLLNQITGIVQAEQLFCQEFFNPCSSSPNNNISKSDSNTTANNQQSLQRNNSSSSLQSSASTNISKQSNESSKIDLAILNQIFSNSVEEHVKHILDSTIKSENLMVLFLYSDLLNRVLVSHNHRQFVHQPLIVLLRFAKDRCDEYVGLIKDTIKAYRANKKEKIGLLRYITFFEEFVKEAEICWEPIKKDMYEKLCIIYQSIVNEIYNGIEAVANDSQKTPPDVVKFQNYHQLNHILRSVSGLKESVKYTREQYLNWKQSYIKELFGTPLDKIHSFFEKVEAKIERGYKPEDISYQLELSVNNLREIIAQYPAYQVKKGLDNLYNKVQKHLVENSSLLEVVWCDMSSEFISQYKNYEKLIQLCYPGQRIAFEFSEEDICQFFQEIAQSH